MCGEQDVRDWQGLVRGFMFEVYFVTEQNKRKGFQKYHTHLVAVASSVAIEAVAAAAAASPVVVVAVAAELLAPLARA